MQVIKVSDKIEGYPYTDTVHRMPNPSFIGYQIRASGLKCKTNNCHQSSNYELQKVSIPVLAR